VSERVYFPQSFHQGRDGLVLTVTFTFGAVLAPELVERLGDLGGILPGKPDHMAAVGQDFSLSGTISESGIGNFFLQAGQGMLASWADITALPWIQCLHRFPDAF
jgi:hypothetical protein